MRVTIRGLSVHPGTAKDKLVNAVKLASELVLSVPRRQLSPETTEGREGYVHPHRISGSTEEAIVDFIARDHDDELLASHVELLRGLAQDVEMREPRAKVDVEVRHSYRNMRPFIEENPRVVEAALEAIRRAGVEPRLAITRGGTDGAVLSAQGLPTPNLFTGGQEYHSVREWASVQDMAAAAATIVELAGVWAESLRGSSVVSQDVARLVGINHVAVQVGDIDEMLEFLGRLVDRLELRGRSGGMAFVDMGDQFIALERTCGACRGRSLRPRRRRPGRGRSAGTRGRRSDDRRTRLPRSVGEPLAGRRLPRHPVHEDRARARGDGPRTRRPARSRDWARRLGSELRDPYTDSVATSVG